MNIKEIENDVRDIIIHSQAYPFDLNIKPLINQWYEAKKKFISNMGGIIWRSPEKIKIDLTPEQKHSRFMEFKNTMEENELLYYANNGVSFDTFISENEEGFFDNKTVKAYNNIPAGSKLSKSFKHFLPDDNTTRWAQDTASRYIQEGKIEGYLYISVDPRDFLTISENAENWTSCHSLDGDYRAGNLNYMVDETTLVCYIADEEKKHYDCLPNGMNWYSKKWRMLVHKNSNIIYYDKQYPFKSDILLDKVYEALKDIGKDYSAHIQYETYMKPYTFGFKQIINNYNETMNLATNHIYAHPKIINTESVVDVIDYYGYCDIINSNNYLPTMSCNIYSNESDINVFKIKIGKDALCPCCGETFIDEENSLLCPECRAEKDADEDLFPICGSCGHRIYDLDNACYSEGEIYCVTCYQEKEREDN